ISAGQTTEIRRWDVATGKALPPIDNEQTKTKHERGVYGLAFSPDGKTLASSDLIGGIHLWDVGFNRLSRELKGHLDRVTEIAFSGDGKIMASGGYDGTVLIWDVARALKTR